MDCEAGRKKKRKKKKSAPYSLFSDMHRTTVMMYLWSTWLCITVLIQKLTLIDMTIPYTVRLYDNFTCSCLVIYYMSSVE